MTIILLTLTAVATSAAAAMALVARRAVLAERQREDARVEMLMALAADGVVDAGFAPQSSAPVAPEEAPLAAPDVARREETPASAGDLFVHEETASAWPRRILAAAGLAAVVVLATTVARGGDEDQPAVPQEPAAAPLELIALDHARDGESLVIRGLVQNPDGGLPVSGVSVSAALIGSDDRFTCSATAPLDARALVPGTQAPFTIRVARHAGISKYRVSFKAPDGRLLAHVDQRGRRTIAQRREPEYRP